MEIKDIGTEPARLQENKLFNEQNLRLLSVSLRLFARSANFVGQNDLATVAKSAGAAVYWVQGYQWIKSYRNFISSPKKYISRTKPAEKKHLPIWKTAVYSIGMLITPLKFSEKLGIASYLGSWGAFAQEAQAQNLENLENTFQDIRPGLNYLSIEEAIKQFYNLPRDASSEERKAVYAALILRANLAARIALQHLGYKKVAQGLGVFSAGYSLVKIFQGKSLSQFAFKELQKETVKRIDAFACEAQTKSNELLKKEDERIFQLMDICEKIEIGRVVALEGAEKAEKSGELADLLSVFLLCSKALEENHVVVSMKGLQDLEQACRKLGRKIEATQRILEEALGDLNRQLEEDLSLMAKTLTRLRIAEAIEELGRLKATHLEDRCIKVNMDLLEQSGDLHKLLTPVQENSLEKEPEQRGWQSAASTFLADPAIEQTHAEIQELCPPPLSDQTLLGNS